MNKQRNLRFEEVDIYYNYVFDLGYAINPIDAARRLLKTKVGLVFCNPLTGEAEVGEHFTPLLKGYEKLQMLLEDSTHFHDHPGLRTYLRLARHNPAGFSKAIFDALFSTMISKKRVLPGEKNELRDSEPEEVLADLRKSAQTEIQEQEFFLRIHEHTDKQVFSSLYRESLPFVRVGLDTFKISIAGEEIVVDVTVTIHRSGVAILSAYVVFSGSFTADDLIRLRRGNNPLDSCKVPTALYKRYLELYFGRKARKAIVQKALQELTKEHYIPIEIKETQITLKDILEMYSLYVADSVAAKPYQSLAEYDQSRRTALWRIYPIVYAKRTMPKYASGATFKQKHTEEVGRILLDMEQSRPVKHELIEQACAHDLSILNDHSFYMGEGFALGIFYGDHMSNVPQELIGNEWVYQKFSTSVVVDILLLQYEILSAFNVSLTNVTYDVMQLTTLRNEYARMLEEFEWLDMTNYGTVTHMIRHGQEVFRMSDKRNLFRTKIEHLESLVRVAEAQNLANRTRLVKRLTAVGAVIAALPTAAGIVKTVSDWPVQTLTTYPSAVQLLYAWFIADPIRATLLLSGIIATIALASIFIDTRKNINHNRILEDRSNTTTRERLVSPFKLTIRQQKRENKVSTGAEKKHPDIS